MNSEMRTTPSSGATIATIIFWASIWGIAEATIGWLLHRAHVAGVGFILFPLALLCMTAAVNYCGRARAASWVALGAAVIKLTDIFLLGPLPLYYVVNPAIHIALEGLAVAAFYHFTLSGDRRGGYPRAYFIGFGLLITVFVIFKAWQAGVSALVIENPGVSEFWHSPERMLSALGQMAVRGGWLLVGLWAARRLQQRASGGSWSASPALACVAGAAAVVVTLITF